MFRESASRSVVSDSLQPHELYSPWNSPGQNTGVDSCYLLQRIFPTPSLQADSLPAEPLNVEIDCKYVAETKGGHKGHCISKLNLIISLAISCH